jgi:hypothetical protein
MATTTVCPGSTAGGGRLAQRPALLESVASALALGLPGRFRPQYFLTRTGVT